MQRDLGYSFTLVLVAVVASSVPARAQTASSTGVVAAETVETPVAKTRVATARERADDAAVAVTAQRAADEGFLLPFSQSPRTFAGYVVTKAIAGYDTALKDMVARTSAEGRLLPILALRLDFDHGPGMGPSERFGVGARLSLLQQAAHGVDGAIAVAYQPNDFRDEGHIVGSILVGRSFGRLRLLGNILFGSDPEGDDRAAEARASALYRVLDRFHLGVDTRFRYNASEDDKRIGTQTTDWELQASPTASFAFGSVALLGQAGLSMIRSTGPFATSVEQSRLSAGLVAMAGAGAAF